MRISYLSPLPALIAGLLLSLLLPGIHALRAPDWFAPEAAEVSQKGRLVDRDLYYWDAVFLEVPMDFGHHLHIWKRRILNSRPKWICCTNNYAMVKAPEIEALFPSHLRASRWVQEHRDRVRVIPGRWSVMNRTLASQTWVGILRPEWRGRISRSELLRKYARYCALYRRPPAAGTEWCRPYQAWMDALMSDLLPKGAGSV